MVELQDPPTQDPAEDPTTYDAGTFWEGRLRAQFDLAGVGFRRIGQPFNRALYRQREIVLGRIVRSLGIEAGSADVVELGPGTGFYVGFWQRWGARTLWGLDITEVATERLAADYPDYRFDCVDISERWPLEDASADVVTAFDVLFHVVDDARYEAAIAEAARVARPGAVFLISDLFPHRDRFGGFHQVSRTLPEVTAILRSAGFDVLRRVPVFVTMHPAFDAPRPLAGIAARWWSWLEGTLADNPKKGWRLGRILGAVDRVLTRLLPTGGPSTEILIARRR